MNGKYYYGTGRRKSSVARVFLQKGTGQIIVNGRPVDEFFAREIPELRQEIQHLLAAMDAPTNGQPDALIAAIDQYGTLLGKRLPFQSMAEFDDFMLSDQPLRL